MIAINEEWINVLGYNGYYSVSNMGRVKSLKRIIMYSDGRIRTLRERILKTYVGKTGYETVVLNKGGISVTFSMHRLVADEFIERERIGLCVNHIDGVKTNNKVSNLEVVTYSENLKHKYRVLGHKHNNIGKHNTKNASTAILQLDPINGVVINEFPSIAEATRQLGVRYSSVSSIVMCAKGKYKTAIGFKWQYKSLSRSNKQKYLTTKK